MKKIKALSTILILTFFFACKKDDSSTKTNDLIPPGDVIVYNVNKSTLVDFDKQAARVERPGCRLSAQSLGMIN